MKKARLAQNALALSALLTWLAPCPEAQTVTPTSIQFEVTADSLTAPIFPGIVGSFGVTSPAGTGWQYLGNQGGQNQPDFIVVSPSHGASSSVTFIGLNPNVFPYLRPGNYGFSAEFGLPGQALPSTPGPVFVVLTVDPPPPPVVSSVVSAASLQPQIAPGELISIFGANIGTPPVSSQYNDAGLYPTTLGNTTVTIGGTAAPLLYVNQTQINAVVPFEVAGQQSVNVVVTHDSVAAPTFSVPIAGTAPAIFTATGTGKGQGAIIQNSGSPVVATPNSANNPAPVGSIVAIYATGGGLLNPAVEDGSVTLLGGVTAPIARVSLTIGGQPAQIQYAAPAPYEVSGMLQINVVVPQGIGSGAQPVVLKIGSNDNTAQQITVVIK